MRPTVLKCSLNSSSLWQFVVNLRFYRCCRTNECYVTCTILTKKKKALGLEATEDYSKQQNYSPAGAIQTGILSYTEDTPLISLWRGGFVVFLLFSAVHVFLSLLVGPGGSPQYFPASPTLFTCSISGNQQQQQQKII